MVLIDYNRRGWSFLNLKHVRNVVNVCVKVHLAVQAVCWVLRGILGRDHVILWSQDCARLEYLVCIGNQRRAACLAGLLTNNCVCHNKLFGHLANAIAQD
jgi:hypothetical protein